jgi:hypothetical protein
LDAIYKVDDLSFSLNKRKKRDFYKKANHEIFLEKDYVISENRQFNLIEIKHKGTRKNQPIFKIKKDKNTYFVYDKNYDGLKIVIKNNMLEIYDNKNLISKYKLIKK